MKHNGFTLMEVMIALAILSVALVVLFSQQATSLARGVESRVVTRATLLAQERMAEVLSQEDISEGEEEGEVADITPPLKWRQVVEEAPVEGMLRVTVIVAWQEGTHKREVRLVTYVSTLG